MIPCCLAQTLWCQQLFFSELSWNAFQKAHIVLRFEKKTIVVRPRVKHRLWNRTSARFLLHSLKPTVRLWKKASYLSCNLYFSGANVCFRESTPPVCLKEGHMLNPDFRRGNYTWVGGGGLVMMKTGHTANTAPLNHNQQMFHLRNI